MRLRLLNLIAPRLFLGGLSDSLASLLKLLPVTRLSTAWSEEAVLYLGTAEYLGDADLGDGAPDATVPATPEHRSDSGAALEWGSARVEFRLTLPRRGSQQLSDALAALPDPPTFAVKELWRQFHAADALATAPSEFPGSEFTLELLLSGPSLRLPDSFRPAQLDGDGVPVPDPSFDAVRFEFPRIAVTVSQGEEWGDIDLSFRGWDVGVGFDDALSREAGELVRMTPPLCLISVGKKKGRHVLGFGVESIVLDLSDEFTPPQILEQFGAGDEFTGLWLPHVRFFWAVNQQRTSSFDLFAKDFLWDFDRGLSGEFGLTYRKDGGFLEVEPRIVAGGQVFEVTEGKRTDPGDAARSMTIAGSRTTTPLPAGATLQLAIGGGAPHYRTSVTQDGEPVAATADADTGRSVWPLTETDGQSTIRVELIDRAVAETDGTGLVATDGSQRWTETITVTFAAADAGSGDGDPAPPRTPAVRTEEETGDAGYTLTLATQQPYADRAVVRLSPVQNADVKVGGASRPTAAEFTVPLEPDQSRAITAHWPAAAGSEAEEDGLALLFPFDVPHDTEQARQDAVRAIEAGGYGVDCARDASRPDAGGPEFPVARGPDALPAFVERAGEQPISIVGYASWETPEQPDYNQELSRRRAEVVREALAGMASNSAPAPTLNDAVGAGFAAAETFANGRSSGYGECWFRRVDVSFPIPISPSEDATRTLKIARDAATTAPTPPAAEPPARVTAPPAPPPPAPDWIRKLGVRGRLQRNTPVFGEAFGQVDFQTALEDSKNRLFDAAASDSRPDASAEALALPEPVTGDGVVDFRLSALFDPASGRWREELQIGSGQADPNGIAQWSAPAPASGNGGAADSERWLTNTLGALLVFAPLLGETVDAAVTADDGEAALPLALTAVQVGVAATLGTTGVWNTQRITLYGGKIVTQHTRDESFDRLAVLFDYAVEFHLCLELGPLTIKTKCPDDAADGDAADGNAADGAAAESVKVRYRAMGLELDFENDRYRPVFDSAAGYEFGLANPALFDIGEPLGSILKVLAARVRKVNPHVLELDLGTSADLGVFTLERFRVSVTLDDDPEVTLQPAAAGVNIPQILKGRGFVDLDDGVTGGLDLTLIPARLRLEAGVKIARAPGEGGRSAAAVLVTLAVTFPSAIPLFGSGLGLYGVLGLFAMHFKRNEDDEQPVPALHWFKERARGNPASIEKVNDVDPWTPELGSWAFGVGAVLGTMEGGVLVNLRGMLLLELPGPRFLLFMRAKILSDRPKLDTDGAAENASETGVLATVDVDLAADRISIGMVIDYSGAKPLLSLRAPIAASFSTETGSDWSVDLGTYADPISADVLGLQKATGYLMLDGEGLSVPIPNRPKLELAGPAVAAGMRTEMKLGSESARVYLKASAGFDAGLSFSPFYLAGQVRLAGELRILFASLGVEGTLYVEAPDPTYVRGEVCGSIDLGFFDIDGCVGFEWGGARPLPNLPSLAKRLTLQSCSPALLEGQGSDRPIDASLGEAVELSADGTEPADELPVVPIDSILLLELAAPPVIEEPLPGSFDYVGQSRGTSDGAVQVTEDLSVRYELKSITLERAGGSAPDQLPAVEIPRANSPGGADATMRIALLSVTPEVLPQAFVRSAERTETVTRVWGDVCEKAAPPAPTLWVFAGQPLGPSPSGWRLDGLPWPDPPGVVRSAPPELLLEVRGSDRTPAQRYLESVAAAVGAVDRQPAEIVGRDPRSVPGREMREQDRVRALLAPRELPVRNPPRDVPGALRDQLLRELGRDFEQVVVHVGETAGPVRLLIAVSQASFPRWKVRLLNEDGELLEERPLGDRFRAAASLSQGPPDWQDASGPWFRPLRLLFSWLDKRRNQYPDLLIGLVELPRLPRGVARVALAADRPPQRVDPRAQLLVGAIEVLRLREIERAAFDASAQRTKQGLASLALDPPGEAMPLLEPDETYTVAVEWSGTISKRPPADAKHAPSPEEKGIPARTQRFRFRTDAVPPTRLDPWVLATSPVADDRSHFYEDPVTCYFNDRSAVDLYGRYGRRLEGVLRKADGTRLSPTELTAGDLHLLDTAVAPPFQETLRESLAEGEGDCVELGISRQHRSWTVPLPLEPRESYVFEVLSTSVADPTDSTSVFRRTFRTSRYASAKELAEAFRATRIGHRLLTGPLDLPDGATDAQIEQALRAAGAGVVPPADRPTWEMLWRAEAGGFRLEAFLLDAPEPLHRVRPRINPDHKLTDEESGVVRIAVVEPETWLHVVDQAGGRVVASPGGTRAFVFPEAGATKLDLQLQRKPSQFALADQAGNPPSVDAFELYADAVPTVPPWEDA